MCAPVCVHACTHLIKCKKSGDIRSVLYITYLTSVNLRRLSPPNVVQIRQFRHSLVPPFPSDCRIAVEDDVVWLHELVYAQNVEVVCKFKLESFTKVYVVYDIWNHVVVTL